MTRVRLAYLILAAITIVAIAGVPRIYASAQNPPSRSDPKCFRMVCDAIASKDGSIGSKANKDRINSSGNPDQLKSGSTEDEEARAVDRAYDAWVKASADYRRCLTRFDPIGEVVACGTAPIVPDMLVNTGFSSRGTGPAITPAQAGAVAAARLQLPTLAPGIGPSPQLNPWKMAAVGYPLWLWPDGQTRVGPVSDSVAGLAVSLTAEVSKVSFRMGDGNTVTCPAESKRWTNAVEPGQKSPTCGYAYEKPSLPKGNYTVTAVTTWNVTWTVNNQSGVITVPAVQATQLPVGELQVLVR